MQDSVYPKLALTSPQPCDNYHYSITDARHFLEMFMTWIT
jgi:hypothetical protein